MQLDVLLELDRLRLVNEDTIIIVEASKDTTFDYIEDTDLEIYKEKDYKQNSIVVTSNTPVKYTVSRMNRETVSNILKQMNMRVILLLKSITITCF